MAKVVGYNRDQKLRKRYGINAKQFDVILEKQGGGCAICGSDEGQMVVDHDHTVPSHYPVQIRGILCRSCNIALGHVGDNPNVLRRMIGYLNGY